MKINNTIVKELHSFDEVLYYQIDIINRNPILQLFVPVLKLNEGTPCLEIDTKGFISLEEWVKKNIISKSMVLEILEFYFESLIICENYFLNAKNFAPGFSGIYITKG